MSAVRPVSGISLAARYAVPFVLLLIPLWMAKVNTVVPDPYLDEVFHVPQAQVDGIIGGFIGTLKSRLRQDFTSGLTSFVLLR